MGGMLDLCWNPRNPREADYVMDDMFPQAKSKPAGVKHGAEPYQGDFGKPAGTKHTAASFALPPRSASATELSPLAPPKRAAESSALSPRSATATEFSPLAPPKRAAEGAGSPGEWFGGGGAAAAEPPLARSASGDSSFSKANMRPFRVRVAEENYNARRRWLVPRTVAAPWLEVSRLEPPGPAPGGGPCAVTFSGASTADALVHLASQRGVEPNEVCGLNFANGDRVGGGYKTGAMAQEEDLCRRIPNLYTSLNNAKRDGLYPFGPCTCRAAAEPGKYSDVLYTPDCVVARRGEARRYEWMQPHKQAKVALVTAAAPNIGFASEVSDPGLMYNTVKAAFLVPRLHEPSTTTLVLGAWGCGAFGGDPRQISELFARALGEGLGNLYKEVHFAIPTYEATDVNASVFRETLRKHNIGVKDLDIRP